MHSIIDKNGKGLGEIPNEEIKMQQLLNKLSIQAEKKNGRIIKLLGNHELEHLNKIDPNWITMYSTDYTLKNEQGDYENAKTQLNKSNKNYKQPYILNSNILNNVSNNRANNYGPKGNSSAYILNCNSKIIVKIGDWICVHAGIVPKLIEYVYKLMNIDPNNKEAGSIFFKKTNELLKKKYNNKLSHDELNLYNIITQGKYENGYELFKGIVWDRTLGLNITEKECNIILPKLFKLLGFNNARIVVAHCSQFSNGILSSNNNESYSLINKGKYTKNAQILEPNNIKCVYNNLNNMCPKFPGITYQSPDNYGIGKLWRIDVAMSRGFDIIKQIYDIWLMDTKNHKNLINDYWISRKPQVLEIIHYSNKPDKVKVLRSKKHLPRDKNVIKNYLNNKTINHLFFSHSIKPSITDLFPFL